MRPTSLAIAVLAVQIVLCAPISLASGELAPRDSWKMAYGAQEHLNSQQIPGSMTNISSYGLLWMYDWGEHYRNELSFADLDGDGVVELLLLDDMPGDLVAISVFEGPLWRFSEGPPSRALSVPTIFDLDRDGKEDLVFALMDGRVYALNSTGHVMWRYSTDLIVETDPLVVDSEGGIGSVIVVNAYRSDHGRVSIGPLKEPKSELHTLSTRGELVERTSMAEGVTYRMPVVLPKDGGLEILGLRSYQEPIDCTGMSYEECDEAVAARKTGSILFSLNPISKAPLNGGSDLVPFPQDASEETWFSGWNGVAPAVVDFENDDIAEVVFNTVSNDRFGDTPGFVRVTTRSGELRSEATTLTASLWARTIADFDGDGNAAIAVGTVDGVEVFEWNRTLQVLERAASIGVGQVEGLTSADLDGDKAFELIVGVNEYRQEENRTVSAVGGKLLVLRLDGTVLYEYVPRESGFAYVVPIDVDDDGVVEIVAMSDNGFLYVFGQAASGSGKEIEDEAFARRSDPDYMMEHHKIKPVDQTNGENDRFDMPHSSDSGKESGSGHIFIMGLIMIGLLMRRPK